MLINIILSTKKTLDIIKRQKQIFCVLMPRAIIHGRTEDLFMLGTGVKFNELLIIYCISLCFFYLWELPSTLAPAAYSHGSVAKQWPRNCEPPGSKPCRCAKLVPFCGA